VPPYAWPNVGAAECIVEEEKQDCEDAIPIRAVMKIVAAAIRFLFGESFEPSMMDEKKQISPKKTNHRECIALL
jgi:hypothetical protein